MQLQHHHHNGSSWVGKDAWWKDAVFYQVYPASFKDSNGDGWGDIPGVIAEIDHLHDLGVDVVWLSPMFESPQKDMGYDISDYQKVYARYGTVADVDALVAACHDRGMRLILDLVVNHTSDQHAWFREARASKTSAKRDWYIWRPARYDSCGRRLPPTNWRSYFAGSTWTWDEGSEEYYLHLYDSSQPDLNWESPACRQAIYDNAIRFWLDRGVDGFRIDTVNKYSKRTDFPDAPVTLPGAATQPAPEMWCNGPRIHEFLREMRTQALDPYGAVSVGELSNTPRPDQVLPYVSAAAHELDMAFEFSMIRLGTGGMFDGKYLFQPFRLSELKRHVATWQTFLDGTDGWHTVFCENHDNGRAVSRFGDDSSPALWAASAKALALWQATLTGTLFLYQGQEIGMTNMPRTWPIDEYKDVESRGFYDEACRAGDPARLQATLTGLRILARDHARLPFQWDASAHAGFSPADAAAAPWMRPHDNYRDVNAAKQRPDPDSVLSFYKRVLVLRKQHADLFVHGAFRHLVPDDEALFVYVKESAAAVASADDGTPRRALVVLNFTSTPQPCIDNVAARLACAEGDVRLLVSTAGPAKAGHLQAELAPWEGRVYLNFTE